MRKFQPVLPLYMKKVKILLRHLGMVGIRGPLVNLVPLMGACVEWWWMLMLSQTRQLIVGNLDAKLNG